MERSIFEVHTNNASTVSLECCPPIFILATVVSYDQVNVVEQIISVGFVVAGLQKQLSENKYSLKANVAHLFEILECTYINGAHTIGYALLFFHKASHGETFTAILAVSFQKIAPCDWHVV